LWAVQQLATLRLPDERLAVRAARFLAQKALRPSDSILQGAASPAAAKAAYRFLENRRVSARPHWDAIHERTAQGLRDLPWALSVQDTTALMFSGLEATTGLGTADRRREEALWMHSALALRPDGHPVGLLHNHVWARPLAEFGKGHQRKSRPFEDKESFEWVRGIRRTAKLRDRVSPGTRLVHVFDTAGDVHEVLAEVVGGSDDAVIRSARDRCVAGEHGHLRATLAAAPLLRRYRLDVPRTQGRRTRTATIELRTATVTITPSAAYPDRGPVRVNAVWVHEPEPPEGVEGLDWLLLTTLPVGTVRQARRVVELYRLRWRVEEFHLVLKSGCRVEKTQLKTAERIETLLALLCAVAVRVLQLTHLARTEPDAPCTVMLEDDEWRVLVAYIEQRGVGAERAPPSLREAVRMIGRLGGHLGRKGDGMPGVRSLWRGWRDLCLLVEGWRAAQL
jgi:hypothetical protein